MALDYMTDTTYSILKLVSGQLIPQSNPTLFITFYQNGKPVGQDTGWTNVITEFDQGTGLVTFDTLLAERSIINEPDTFFKVADDNTLWTWPIDSFDSLRSIPFINNRFAKTPLTQGVATFDGTKADGYPYDISSATSLRTCGCADFETDSTGFQYGECVPEFFLPGGRTWQLSR